MGCHARMNEENGKIDKKLTKMDLLNSDLKWNSEAPHAVRRVSREQRGCGGKEMLRSLLHCQPLEMDSVIK